MIVVIKLNGIHVSAKAETWIILQMLLHLTTYNKKQVFVCPRADKDLP